MFEGGNVGTDEWSGWFKAGLGAEPGEGFDDALLEGDFGLVEGVREVSMIC